MIVALDMDSIALDSRFAVPAIVAEASSTSAFDIDLPVRPHRRPIFHSHSTKHGADAVSLTDISVSFNDPSTSMVIELKAKAAQAHAYLQEYNARIDVLCAFAEQEDYSLKAASKHDFMHFIRSEPFIRKSNLVLMDNGNLRALWKNDKGDQVGLQFLGGRKVQYVIFKRRTADGEFSRVAGRDTFEGVKRQIFALELPSLIYS